MDCISTKWAVNNGKAKTGTRIKSGIRRNKVTNSSNRKILVRLVFLQICSCGHSHTLLGAPDPSVFQKCRTVKLIISSKTWSSEVRDLIMLLSSYGKTVQHFKEDRADNNFGDKQSYISVTCGSNYAWCLQLVLFLQYCLPHFSYETTNLHFSQV